MINKQLIKNAANLIMSNIIMLFISLLSAFVTPVVLGHDQYGYYKIFTLYITYVPLLHAGFIDGILVRYAGKKIDELVLDKFRSYTRFIFFFELSLSLFMIILVFLIPAGIYYKAVWLSIAIYSFLLNLVTYFQFFSKCILRFDELSKIMRLQSYINFVYLALAYAIYKFNIFKIDVGYYLVSMCIMQLIILIWYIIRYRNIIFGNRYSFKKMKMNIFILFRDGFLVMLSYQIIMFMINSDNQFISIFFSVSRYSEYAFAYSLAFILVTVFGAVTSVVLPYMKKAGKSIVIKQYEFNLSIICSLVFMIMFAYYPIVWIVNNFLISYADSIQYLRIVFPGVGITCIVQAYFFNNYILFSKTKIFCLISILNLLVDYFVYYIVYVISNSTFIIALCSIPLLILWYTSLEVFMHKWINVKILRNILYVFIMSLLFILINHVLNYYVGMVTYLIAYIVVTCFMYINIVRNVKDKLENILK